MDKPAAQRAPRRAGIGRTRLAALGLLFALASVPLGGCAVAGAMGTTASLLVSTVGLATDVTIGAAKVTGKAIGAAAGTVTPGSNDK